MDIAWIRDAVLAKEGGLPGDHSRIFQSSLALHLGSALPAFHRSAALLLRTLCQAGMGRVTLLENPGQREALDAVLAEVPTGLTYFRRSGVSEMGLMTADMGICIGGDAATALAMFTQFPNGPFLWVNCCHSLAMLLPFDGVAGRLPLVGESFYLLADRMLRALATPAAFWRSMLCTQFAVFLAASYVSRNFSGSALFPWLVIDMENARLFMEEQGLLNGIDRVRLGIKLSPEDFDWVDLYS